MNSRCGRSLVVAIVLTLGACSSGPETTEVPAGSPDASTEPSAAPAVQDIMELEGFAPLKPGTYFIDPDRDPSTPLRVVYEVPVMGWSQWIGAAKFTGNQQVAVSITTVPNLVRQACRNHSPVDPPVGPGVTDLATALAHLAPFRVTASPEDVTVNGYRGKYLELTVPDLPVEGDDFAGCTEGQLQSWMSPNLGPPGDNAFYGYNVEPGRIEEFWILDVDGTRLVIETSWSPASPHEDVAEMRAIFDSIRIKP